MFKRVVARLLGIALGGVLVLLPLLGIECPTPRMGCSWFGPYGGDYIIHWRYFLPTFLILGWIASYYWRQRGETDA